MKSDSCMKEKALQGKVVVVTRMRRVPQCCSQCGYYDNMCGVRGRGNDGACRAFSEYGYVSTRHICVTKERLPSCPLVQAGRG